MMLSFLSMMLNGGGRGQSVVCFCVDARNGPSGESVRELTLGLLITCENILMSVTLSMLRTNDQTATLKTLLHFSSSKIARGPSNYWIG